MNRSFNVTGACNPQFHYMVDIQNRLEEIKKLVDKGAYFTINRVRQYGKTTTLAALKKYLCKNYVVISTDFQMLSHSNFATEGAFVRAFARELSAAIGIDISVPDEIKRQLQVFAKDKTQDADLGDLFYVLSSWCAESEKPVVLMIDEVDSATNNQVFLDFLAQLRGYYIHRAERPTFQAVILAGVYDVKNIKRKIRSEEEHEKNNSPWNIATDFNVDMSFTAGDIAGMLWEYETEHQTSMDVENIAILIYDYTSGYPFLVSRLCKIMDENVIGREGFTDLSSVWTKEGFLEGLKILLSEKNTLFESLINELFDCPELRKVIYTLLFDGKEVPYNSLNKSIEVAEMFGFVKNENNKVAITNRIFETVLHNFFLSEEVVGSLKQINRG